MELNDYYKILGLKYKFNELDLLGNYFRTVRIALANENKEDFIKARMGFEVLRNENVVEEYNRLYRKYVLNEELNYPSVREQQMLTTLQAKENLGSNIAREAIATNEPFSAHLLKFILKIIAIDLLGILALGASGILFIVVGIYVFSKFHNQINIVGGVALILFGIFMLRRNVIAAIRN
jgi:hypothetical protein